MINKILSYVFVILGLIGISIGLGPIYDIAIGLLPFIESFDYRFIVGGGILFVIVGVVLMRKSGGRGKVSEVPIYQGKDVVGYRRMKKR